MRVVSRAGSSSTAKSRTSSIIVHETDEEIAALKKPSRHATQIDTLPEEQHHPSTRRKAKETQYRLGVGRPTVIGGAGPRAVTVSATRTKGKRTKGSASVQPTEEAIREEDEGKTNQSISISRVHRVEFV